MIPPSGAGSGAEGRDLLGESDRGQFAVASVPAQLAPEEEQRLGGGVGDAQRRGQPAGEVLLVQHVHDGASDPAGLQGMQQGRTIDDALSEVREAVDRLAGVTPRR